MTQAQRITELEAEVKELKESLEYYTSRGQIILELTAQRCLAALRDETEPMAAPMMNVIRQFLKDQGIIDLKNGPSPTNHLLKEYPFAKAQKDAADFGVRETS